MAAVVPVSSVQVAPDPAITSTIGRHHSLETAVADLVDNSIDAGARTVLIRFVLRDGAAVGLQVVDDGCGMDTRSIDAAMQYARPHERSEAALGHFGVGLKAASLSQADTLLVWSRRFGAPAVGRRLRKPTLDSGPLVESFAAHDADHRLASEGVLARTGSGTLVEWEDVRSFLHADDAAEQTKWLEKAVETVLRHLGTVYHRLLARETLEISVEVVEGPHSGVPRPVRPLDPFDYPVSGARRFPVDLVATMPEGRASFAAHIWPESGTSLKQFVLDGGGPLKTQGLYVYRHDRLLQAGGWCGLARTSPEFAFARVAVDLDGPLVTHATINPEKTGVVLDSTLSEAMASAQTSDGRRFQDFLEVASGHAKQSRGRRPRPITLVEPRGGLPATVRHAFEEAAGFSDGDEPFDIRWRTLPADQFFHVDLEGRRLNLNLRYRSAVVGRGKSMDPLDAPLVKSLLFLLLNSHLSGSVRGAREKRLEAAWQQILVAAVQAQPRPEAEA